MKIEFDTENVTVEEASVIVNTIIRTFHICFVDQCGYLLNFRLVRPNHVKGAEGKDIPYLIGHEDREFKEG